MDHKWWPQVVLMELSRGSAVVQLRRPAVTFIHWCVVPLEFARTGVWFFFSGSFLQQHQRPRERHGGGTDGGH